MKEYFLQVNGATLWVWERGSGLRLVLISGGPGCYNYLEPVATLINDAVHTISKSQTFGKQRKNKGFSPNRKAA